MHVAAPTECSVTGNFYNKRAQIALFRSLDYQKSFKSIGLSVQEKFNIDFEDGGHGSHLGFPIGMF